MLRFQDRFKLDPDQVFFDRLDLESGSFKMNLIHTTGCVLIPRIKPCNLFTPLLKLNIYFLGIFCSFEVCLSNVYHYFFHVRCFKSFKIKPYNIILFSSLEGKNIQNIIQTIIFSSFLGKFVSVKLNVEAYTSNLALHTQ